MKKKIEIFFPKEGVSRYMSFLKPSAWPVYFLFVVCCFRNLSAALISLEFKLYALHLKISTIKWFVMLFQLHKYLSGIHEAT